MKLTPFAKFFVTLIILGVVGYVLYVKRDTITQWANQGGAKPTTSAGSGVSARRTISVRAPTDRRVRPPRASISRPFTAATRPETDRGSTRSTAEISDCTKRGPKGAETPVKD